MVRIATYGLSRSPIRVQKAPIVVFQGFQRGVPKTRGVVFMGPHYKDSSVLGFILGSLFFGIYQVYPKFFEADDRIVGRWGHGLNSCSVQVQKPKMRPHVPWFRGWGLGYRAWKPQTWAFPPNSAGP